METRKTFGKLTWVDLEDPTTEEMEKLKAEFGIHEIVAQEFMTPTYRPKVDIYKNHIYVILHFPIPRHRDTESDLWEIDFIVGKDFLVSGHYRGNEYLHSVSEHLEHVFREKGEDTTHAGFILYHIASHLYRSLEFKINDIEHQLDLAEEGIFSNNELKMVEKLSVINHDILDFKKAISPHQEILSSFESAGKNFFGEKFGHYLGALTGEYLKIATKITSSKETLRDLQQINDSLLNTKTNQTMKSLTLMAFVTVPLTLIASIFGMNTESPISKSPHSFWIIILIMLITMLGLVIWFKHKKWL